MADAHPSVAALQQCVRYEPETGALFWTAHPPRGLRVGDPVSLVSNGFGYVYARLWQGWKIGVHRLAIALESGQWPEEVDHKNGDRADNKRSNLRVATRRQNEANKPRPRHNTSGFKGVSYVKSRGRWRAYISRNNRQLSLGYHDTPEEASAAYFAAAQKLFGEFARQA
jgi:hypothetical protein